jgi:hypothetical protein
MVSFGACKAVAKVGEFFVSLADKSIMHDARSLSQRPL